MSSIRKKKKPRNNSTVVKVSGLILENVGVGVFGGVVCLFVEVYIVEPSSTGACY